MKYFKLKQIYTYKEDAKLEKTFVYTTDEVHGCPKSDQHSVIDYP